MYIFHYNIYHILHAFGLVKACAITPTEIHDFRECYKERKIKWAGNGSFLQRGDVIANSGLKRTMETGRRKSVPGWGTGHPKPGGEFCRCEEVKMQMAEGLGRARAQRAHSKGGRQRVKSQNSFEFYQ